MKKNTKKITFAILCLLLFNSCKNNNLDKNKIDSVYKVNDRDIKENEQKKSRIDTSNFVGKWCFNVRDSINFILTLSIESNALKGRYSNVMYSGKYLNASDDDEVSFSIPMSTLSYGSNLVNVLNYNNSEIIKANINFDIQGKINWKLIEEDEVKKELLPDDIILSKCN